MTQNSMTQDEMLARLSCPESIAYYSPEHAQACKLAARQIQQFPAIGLSIAERVYEEYGQKIPVDEMREFLRGLVTDVMQNYGPSGAEAASEMSAVFEALDGAHWLSGSAPDRVRALLAERDAAIEGTHPVQRARGMVLIPDSKD